jgi:conjugal transfer mating pair stabilization protein TraN
MKWRRICAFFLALLFGMVSSAHAADCQKTSESCVEGAETRNVGGHQVYRPLLALSTSQFSCKSRRP